MKAVREDVETRADFKLLFVLNLIKEELEPCILTCDRNENNKYFQSSVLTRVQHKNFLREFYTFNQNNLRELFFKWT